MAAVLPIRTLLPIMVRAGWTAELLAARLGTSLEDAEEFFATGRWATLEQQEKFDIFAEFSTGISQSMIDRKTGNPYPGGNADLGRYTFNPPMPTLKISNNLPPALIPETALAQEGKLINTIRSARPPA